jgi:hypothetical protein
MCLFSQLSDADVKYLALQNYVMFNLYPNSQQFLGRKDSKAKA